MARKKIRLTSILFVLLLGLSGVSFGFLLGRSQQLGETGAEQQIDQMTQQVRTGGDVIVRGTRAIQRLLAQ